MRHNKQSQNTGSLRINRQSRQMLSVQALPDTANIRVATLHEQEHTVIPCIALLEGVLWPANAPAPELALAEEFGRFPAAWDGRPVVMNHPVVDGVPVPASSPGVLESHAMGQLFNTKLEDNKLKTEIWINNALVANGSQEIQDTAERLKSGDDTVEVSTGLFTLSELVDGEYEGKEYSAIWRNIAPDHLAILPVGATGACSVADGCGAPRLNASEIQNAVFPGFPEGTPFIPVMRAAVINSNADTDAPVISCACQGEPGAEQEGLFKRLIGMTAGILSFKGSSEHLSDGDVRTALNTAIIDVADGRWFFILAVFQDGNDSGTVIYELGFEGELYSRTFAIDPNSSTITIGGDAQAVRPITTFVPVEVTTNQNSIPQESTMNKEEIVKALIANAKTSFTQDDTEWLTGLEVSQLERMAPTAEAEAPTPDDVAQSVDATSEVSTQEASEDTPAPVSVEDYIANAPTEIQQVLNNSVATHRRHKDSLIESLMANSRNKFTKDALEVKPVDELEQLIQLAGINQDFSANALSLVDNSGSDAHSVPAAPELFPAASA